MSQEQCEAISNTFNRRKYKLAAGFLVFGIGQASALLSVIFISHHLSTEAFGKLSTGLAIQSYVVIVGTLGLRTLVVRDLARYPDQLGKVWGTMWLLTAPVGVGVAFLGNLIAGFFFVRDPAEVWMSMWLAMGAWFSTLSVVPLLDAMRKQTLAFVGVAVTESLFLIAMLGGAIPFDIVSMGAAFAIKWTVASLLQAMMLYLISKPVGLKYCKEQAINWLRSALPLLTTSLIMTMPITGAVILTRYQLGATDTAVMGLAAQIAGAILLLGGVAVRFIQPVWRDAETLRGEQSRKIVRALIAGGVCGWFAVATSVTIVVWCWLPAVYLRGLLSIQLLLLAGALGVMARVLWIVLVAVHREQFIMTAYGCGCFVFGVVAIWLMHSYGSVGISSGSVIGNTATVLMMGHAVRSMLR